MKRSVGRRSGFVAALGAALLVIAAIAAPVSATERPVARIVFEYSCNATGDPFCAPNYFGFRYTATLWADGTGVTQGSFNLHTRGGRADGGMPINDEIEWTATTGPLNTPVGEDPDNLYFNLGVGTLSFPQTEGHYPFHPLPGTEGEVTVIRY